MCLCQGYSSSVPSSGLGISRRNRGYRPVRHKLRVKAAQTRIQALDDVIQRIDFRRLSDREQTRKDYRAVYDFADWERHRSPFRIFQKAGKVGKSIIYGNILPNVMWVMLVSFTLGTYNSLREMGLLPDYPDADLKVAAEKFISSTAIALSLLLVFRTTQTYARWNEARMAWGNLVNRSRDISWQASCYFPPTHPHAKVALSRWVIAFAHALRSSFQQNVDIRADLKDFLKPDELSLLASSPCPPLTALTALSKVISATPVPGSARIAMLANVTYMQDVMGTCDRLLQSPIPASYSRHTARFMAIWSTVLPFALWPAWSWLTIPLAAAITIALSGIEEIGMQYEEPFGLLPLEAICKIIAREADITEYGDLKIDELADAALGRPSLDLRQRLRQRYTRSADEAEDWSSHVGSQTEILLDVSAIQSVLAQAVRSES